MTTGRSGGSPPDTTPDKRFGVRNISSGITWWYRTAQEREDDIFRVTSKLSRDFRRPHDEVIAVYWRTHKELNPPNAFKRWWNRIKL